MQEGGLVTAALIAPWVMKATLLRWRRLRSTSISFATNVNSTSVEATMGLLPIARVISVQPRWRLALAAPKS